MLKPRNTLDGTRAETLLLPGFFRSYLLARITPGNETECNGADAIFTQVALANMRRYLSVEALATPVLLSPRLSNRVLAIHALGRNDIRLIIVNTRFKIDPDVLVHSLVEEFAHAQQIQEGVDIEAQRLCFSYEDRPYEQDAKRIATEIVGYNPEGYEAILLHEEPPGPLFDRHS